MNRTTTTLFALALASLCSTAAQAETIYLKCGTKFSFDVDLTNKTVNNNPAIITSTTIVWDANNSLGSMHWVIDRATGALTETATLHQPSGDISMPTFADGICTKEGAPETKF